MRGVGGVGEAVGGALGGEGAVGGDFARGDGGPAQQRSPEGKNNLVNENEHTFTEIIFIR